MGLFGLLVTVALFVAVVLLAIRFGLHIDPEDAPANRPVWMGPDATALTAALRERLAELRQAAGHPPLVREPALDELAAHAAFDMAARGFLSDSDPEGRGLQARRDRLCPTFAGALQQWQAGVESASTPRTEDLLERLLDPGAGGSSLREWMEDPSLNAVGVSAAVERGRARVCVVLAHHFATLDDISPAPEAEGRTWTGTLPPDGRPEELAGRWKADGGDWSELVFAGPPDFDAPPRDRPLFQLLLPIPVVAVSIQIQLVHGGVPEPVRDL